MNGRVVLAGGSGFIGKSLAGHLKNAGYEPIILTRSPNADSNYREIFWNGEQPSPEWIGALDGSEAIINLAGKSVDCRYTPENRREILASRVNSVKAIAEAIRQCSRPPGVWIQASTAAIYGDAGDRILDETAKAAEGFSPEIAKAWEATLAAADVPSTRKVVFRISFVLGRDGGALRRLGTLTRWFLGGTVGSGKQYVSWIHEFDLNLIFERAIQQDDMRGMYHATSPRPVTNAKFMSALRHALKRPWSPPAPALAVRLGAALMGTESELALRSRYVIPKRLLDEGFVFRFVDIDEALQDVYRS